MQLYFTGKVIVSLFNAAWSVLCIAIGPVVYPVTLPSKLRSPPLLTSASRVCELSLSFRVSVKFWLRVGGASEALFWKYCTETVFASGGTLPPVNEQWIRQPGKRSKTREARSRIRI